MKELVKALILVLVLPFVHEHAQAQGIPLTIGRDTHGFHVPVDLNGKTVFGSFPSNEHVIFFIEDAMKFRGIENDILILETPNLNNAYAGILDPSDREWIRIIIYDANFYNWMIGDDNKGVGYQFILAHEVGHHLCGHQTHVRRGTSQERELEADRAAGALMRNVAMGVASDMNSLLQAMANTVVLQSSGGTHPPLADRLEAARSGWLHGSPCLSRPYQRSPGAG